MAVCSSTRINSALVGLGIEADKFFGKPHNGPAGPNHIELSFQFDDRSAVTIRAMDGGGGAFIKLTADGAEIDADEMAFIGAMAEALCGLHEYIDGDSWRSKDTDDH